MAVDGARSPWYPSPMTVSELAFGGPRTRGRAKKPVEVEFVRELTESDLALLASERGIKPRPIAKLRDRHHALARCLASGMKDEEASAVTGYDPSRISILKADDTFKGLVAFYHSREDAALADFQTRAAVLTLTAMEEIQERLESDEDPVPMGQLLEITKTFADRTGHAPIQRQVNLNANVDLGNRLEAARRRLAQLEAPKPDTPTDTTAETSYPHEILDAEYVVILPPPPEGG